MNNNDCNNLFYINISDIDIISSDKNSNVYKFCLNHKIRTLKDFFDICNKHNKSYDGEACVLLQSFYNLLKFKYFEEINDTILRILNHNFIKLNGEGSFKYRSFNYDLCYSLGFTYYETRFFIQLCKDSNEDKTIGEFIMKFKDLDKLNLISENFPFKLDLLYSYYKKGLLIKQ